MEILDHHIACAEQDMIAEIGELLDWFGLVSGPVTSYGVPLGKATKAQVLHAALVAADSGAADNAARALQELIGRYLADHQGAIHRRAAKYAED